MKNDPVDLERLIAFVQKERTARFARGNVLLQLGRFNMPKTKTDLSLTDRIAKLRMRFASASAFSDPKQK
jgi:hypothetical protein